MSESRVQLTLFIDEKVSETIEKVRREYNPLQYSLIKSHITLCRDDELDQLENIRRNLIKIQFKAFAVELGTVSRFANGLGVLLPTRENESFNEIRKNILKGVIDYPRELLAHITLMHPRNSICTDEAFKKIQETEFPSHLLFDTISLIKQDRNLPWEIIDRFYLTS